MVTLADFSDTASLVSCSHCGQFLQEGDRFCRFCGHEQEISPDAEVITLTDSLQPDGGLPPLVAASAADRGRSRADAHGADGAGGVARLRKPGPIPARWVLGIAVVVLLAVAAALLHDLYRSDQDESTRRAELASALAQVESALARGDLTEVQLKLAILDALNPNDPEIQARRDAFERRVQEMTAERDRLRAAVAKERPGRVPEAARQADLPAAAPPSPPQAPASAAAGLAPAAAAAAAPATAPTPAPATAPATPTPSAAGPVTASAKPPEPADQPASPPAATAAAPPPAQTPAAPASGGTAGCPEALAAMSLCPNR